MTVQPEARIRLAVRRYLQFGGWLCVPIVQSALSYKGIADLVATKDGRTVWVECKTQRGRQSDYQRKFEADIVAHGGEYVVARSIDDVAELCECLR